MGYSPWGRKRVGYNLATTTKCCDIIFKKYLFIWLQQVLIAACRIFSCGMQTLSCDMWDLVPRPEIEPGSPALEAES